ncbi:hypothetical protein HXX76_003393 [Chlamydomonas incerta]|uniref:Uncharacterized protein n=1 Tax=Chlamydomonas incerta TaxID=51695 RepID=A0A835TMT4_CHLIN|nr:hypothetical protein HXX76_003393 [Chlamydomonas incerta]|eukprot:KAG2441780.1 hypothetical protein HXX76_003393 [Chlamydomonas incerta]
MQLQSIVSAPVYLGSAPPAGLSPHPPPGPGPTSSPPVHRRGVTTSWHRAVQAVAVYAPQMAGPLLAGRSPGPHASSSWSHAHGQGSGQGHGAHGQGSGHGHSVSAGGVAPALMKKVSNVSAGSAASGPSSGTPRTAALPRLIPRGIASSGGAPGDGLRLVTSSLDSLPPLIRSAEEGSSRARLGGGSGGTQSTGRGDRRRHSDALGDARYYSYNGDR